MEQLIRDEIRAYVLEENGEVDHYAVMDYLLNNSGEFLAALSTIAEDQMQITISSMGRGDGL